MSVFKVIIIGGSVAGLTLANILERYGIGYVLLEKHECIAPQLGASIGILPYGSRILDQLGVQAEIERICEPVERLQSYGPDGVQLNCYEGFGNMFVQMSGYRFCFLDRRELIQALYDNLRDKSKVLVSAELFRIEGLENRVRVTTKDGRIFEGHILVGADGVHSRTRAEMWRIADSESPNYRSADMASSITCTYKCMFGIADAPDGVPPVTGFKTYRKNRSYLYQSGAGRKFYYFAFLKNREKTVNRSIPRYTAEDKQDTAREYEADILLPGLTFGDLYARSRHSVLVPLEEYVLERCFYKRAILIGDSFHKFNPLTGQGGNSAVEDAALLGDLLKDALDKEAEPTDQSIGDLFLRFQRKRVPRAKVLGAGANALQRLEALETPMLEYLNLRVVSRAGLDKVAPRFAEVISPGYVLRYLPRPSRSGLVAPEDEIVAKPRQRPFLLTLCWVVVMLFISLLAIINHGYDVQKQDSTLIGRLVGSYTFTIQTAVTGLWTVESYRPGSFGGVLSSALAFVLASLFTSWDIVVPIYFALFIVQSRQRQFYYPNPRAIDLKAAVALQVILFAVYALPIIFVLNPQPTMIGAFEGRGASVQHIAFPILLFGSVQLSKLPPTSSDVCGSLYGNRDMPYLSKFYTFLMLVTSVMHITICGRLLGKQGSSEEIVWSSEAARLACLVSALMAWCIFTVLDLHQTNILQTRLSLAFGLVVVGIATIGPAGTLAGLWRWRETLLEESRHRKSTIP